MAFAATSIEVGERHLLIVMLIQHGYAEYGETMAPISNGTLLLAIHYINCMNDVGAIPPGPLLGIDFGTVRVGLAICDRDQKIAVPLLIYDRQARQQEAVFYQDLVKKERITGLVMGLPVHMSGSESKKSKEVKKYGDWLSQVTGLPVMYCDERYTSAFAWDELKAGGLKASQRRKQLDKVAAQILLQAFLDSPRNSTAPAGVESLDNTTPETGEL